MPSRIISGTQVGSIGIARFLLRHWYWIILLLVIIPTIISSIKTAQETKNPSYPFIALGLSITNADALIEKDVKTLENEPQNLIGMEKPTSGIWKYIVYYWKYFWNVIWRFLGNIFLISVPFVFFWKILHRADTSRQIRMGIIAISLALVFIFIVNLIMTIQGLVIGTLKIDIPTTGFFQETWIIIKTIMPFHGLVSLVRYMINLF